MKKFLLSGTVILAFIFYVVYQRLGGSQPSAVPASSPLPPTQLLVPKPSTVPMPPVSNALYKDGEYAGPVTDAYYGNIQIKAVIRNGRISDVVFLAYPSDRQTSVRINTEAMPILTSEVVLAQKANVDIVSGATQTSDAFNQSLASALLRAKI